jgi:hypothetical protein
MAKNRQLRPGTGSYTRKTGVLLLLASVGASLVSGCSTFGERQGGSVTTTTLPALNGAVVLGTEAETRLVLTTPNTRPQRSSDMITCSEPSPDIALIAANAFSGSIGASGALFNDGTSDQARASLAATRAEQAAELGRRLATVQLARDTLFRACEAYANGAIDETMYSVMLSRFDDLMVALFSVEMAQGGDSNEAQVGFGDVTAVNRVITEMRALDEEPEGDEEAQRRRETERTRLQGELEAVTTAASVGRYPGRPNQSDGSDNVEHIAEDFFNDANGDAVMVACISALSRGTGPESFQQQCRPSGSILDNLFAATAQDNAMRRRTEYVRAMAAAVDAISSENIPDGERAALLRALAAGATMDEQRGSRANGPEQ